jgi:hypothetical protein
MSAVGDVDQNTLRATAGATSSGCHAAEPGTTPTNCCGRERWPAGCVWWCVVRSVVE